MTRAQINNLFTMLMTILLIGVIALLAARFANNLSQDKCASELLIQQTTIADVIASNTAYGSQVQRRFGSACKQVQLCFVDARAIRPEYQFSIGRDEPVYQLIQQSVDAGVAANIFSIHQNQELEVLGFVPELELETVQSPLCITNYAGFFEVQLQGKARTTLVREPNR